VHIHEQEWALVKILKNSLKVFYEATVILSGKNYQTLSVSKFVQNALFNYFDQIVDKFGKVTIATQSTSSQQKIEEVKEEIARTLLQYMKTYFKEKVTAKEQKAILVSFKTWEIILSPWLIYCSIVIIGRIVFRSHSVSLSIRR
jgi:hypothetical protein